jgi:predicted transcriptional regulator with HTH domain
MSDIILEGLFDSKIKVKLLRLFFRNANKRYTLDEVINKIHSDPSSTRYQLRKLRKIGLLKSHIIRFEPLEEEKKSSKRIGRERRVYQVNPLFQFYQELKSLILKSTPEIKIKLTEELRKIGRMKLVLITGVFMNVDNAKVDLLVVSDDIQRLKLVRVVKLIEAEMGHEVRYAVMNQQEFEYRLDMYDNFVRALSQVPHEKLIDKIKMF